MTEGRRSRPRVPTRRLAAIMFTDLVGYSALAHRNEDLAIELLQAHRRWVRALLPKHGGIEIETIGDAFLVEFQGALAAVDCAVAIQQHFAEHNRTAPENRRMQLRIGIHLGDVEHKGGKLMGDGVNVASRIHGIAEPGGICVSEDVHHAVRTRTTLSFVCLGAPELKNIETRFKLFRISGAGLPRSGSRQLEGGKRALAGSSLLALVVGAVLGWYATSQGSGSQETSVAVLPFANLSVERDSGRFVDGIHDAVIAHLAGKGDITTVSRTSVLQYRNPARNLREIGESLGVTHVVEGTVRRSGTRVRVTAQLVRVASDHHVWAQKYDRDVADVMEAQNEIGESVATSVHARLTLGDVTAIARAQRQPARHR